MKGLILVLILLGTSFLEAQNDKVEQALRRGLATKDYVQSLTLDDVPQKWRTTREEKDTQDYDTITFYRGGQRILVVIKFKKPIGESKNVFSASIYDGKTRISSVIHTGTSTGICPVTEGHGYEQYVSIKDDGKVSVAIFGKNDYFEDISIDGFNTAPVSDLEYTKSAILMKYGVMPTLEAIKQTVQKPGPQVPMPPSFPGPD